MRAGSSRCDLANSGMPLAARSAPVENLQCAKAQSRVPLAPPVPSVLIPHNRSSMTHRKRVRHVHEAGHLHELTFSCYDRLPLLTNDDWRQRLARSIDAAGAECQVQLYAFVFMPEHVHLLVAPVGQDSISRYLARIKQPFSKEIKSLLTAACAGLLNRLTITERPGKTCFRFWQEGSGYDRNLYSPQAIASSMDYIHANPVTRGLCRKPTDWKWSSAKFYRVEEQRLPDPNLPMLHNLPREALA